MFKFHLKTNKTFNKNTIIIPNWYVKVRGCSLLYGKNASNTKRMLPPLILYMLYCATLKLYKTVITVKRANQCLATASYRKVGADWLREPQTRMRHWNGTSGNRIKGEGGVISRVERIANNFEEIREPRRQRRAIEHRIEQASPSVKA